MQQLRFYLMQEHLAEITHALTIEVDYCNVPYMGLPLKSISKLQLVQNAAAYVLTNSQHWERMTSILQALHYSP